MKTILFCLLMTLSCFTSAQMDQAKSIGTFQVFGEYTVHYNLFNSTFITPEIAKAHGLTRAENRALINISVIRTQGGHASLGLPATIVGTATNLLQQQRVLDFKTINEGEATYYLASLRHSDNEVMNFVIELQPENEDHKMMVRFTRTLHVEK